MEKILLGMLSVFMLILAGCSNEDFTGTDKTQKDLDSTSKAENREIVTDSKSSGILDKVTSTFASDTEKLRKELVKLNSENLTFFTNVEVLKKSNTIEMSFTITDNATSKLILNMFTLGISIISYNVTTDFDDLKITYLSQKKKQVGIITVPKKAIKDIVDYSKQNNEVDLLENPYAEAFWKISNVLYDQSVPELIPNSVAEDMFGEYAAGTSAQDIAKALTKKVTHLEITCGGSQNWDADAEKDGITYFVKPLSADNTVVPIEVTFQTEAYEKVPKDDFGYQYKKGKLVYTRKDTLKGNERLQYFDSYYGYNIALKWEEVEPYLASSSDSGILYVTFTDKEGNSFSAITGEDSFGSCQLREQ